MLWLAVPSASPNSDHISVDQCSNHKKQTFKLLTNFLPCGQSQLGSYPQALDQLVCRDLQWDPADQELHQTALHNKIKKLTFIIWIDEES